MVIDNLRQPKRSSFKCEISLCFEIPSSREVATSRGLSSGDSGLDGFLYRLLLNALSM